MKAELFFNNWDSFLYKYHLYYRSLSNEGKKRFVKRVASIFDNVQILGKEDLEVNDEIKILVVSNLVQLTFGLKEFWLYGYEYIYLYPEAFFVKSDGEAVAGSTYQTKIIALSWHDFAMDHLHARSGKNVSLAQFAQALVRTVFNGKRYDIQFGSYLDTWFEIMRKECALKSTEDAAQQLNENQDDLPFVFAKCVEMFFEKPDLFKKELPTSYAHLCVLLNQDPLNVEKDYALEKDKHKKANVLVPLPKMIPPNYKYKSWHWVFNFPFFGLSLCPMTLYFILENMLIQVEQVIGAMVLTGLVIGLLSFSFFKQLGLFQSRGMLIASSISGFGPCLITFFLFLNQLHGYQFTADVSKHPIASFYQKEHYSNRTITQTITFNYSDNFLVDYPKARTFENFEKAPTSPINLFYGVEYEIRSGLIGIPLIVKREPY